MVLLCCDSIMIGSAILQIKIKLVAIFLKKKKEKLSVIWVETSCECVF